MLSLLKFMCKLTNPCMTICIFLVPTLEFCMDSLKSSRRTHHSVPFSLPLAPVDTKFLVPILEPLSSNKLTIFDSFSFASEISHVKNNHGHVMASFDIKSLFTNIPLEETIDIATNSFFPNENSSVLGLTPGIFRKLLQFAVKNVLFIFNNKMYQQIDGGQHIKPHFSELVSLSS